MDTAADRAASGIRALIASRAYGPGDRLPAERELSQQLGLSRPALREGIHRLRSGGVLESRRGSGTYVIEVDLPGVYDVRSRLEPLAAERAATYRTAAELRQLRALVERMRASLDAAERFNREDAKFHDLIASASRSPVLVSTLAQLAELALLTRAIIAPERQIRLSSFRDVERVCAAIERQHPKRAANAMERHLLNVRTAYVDIAEERSNSKQPR